MPGKCWQRQQVTTQTKHSHAVTHSHTHTHKSLNTPGYCLDRLEVCIKQCLCLKSSALCHQTHCKSANVLIIDQSATSNQISSIWFSLLISKLLKRTKTANVRRYSDQNGRQMNNVCHIDMFNYVLMNNSNSSSP